MTLPRPLVEAYWLGYVESVSQGGSGQELASVPANTPVNIVNIAFYNLFLNSNLTFCFGMGQKHGWDYTKAGIQALQAAGINVCASLIGTPDPQVGWNDLDPNVFAQNCKTLLIDELGCNGINIDNEDPTTPNQNFENVVIALRNVLGPKGGPNSILSYVTYQPYRDLPWLQNVGSNFDYVSTMAYWLDTQGQIDLWQQYANVLGGQNVLIGVSCCSGSQSTALQTVQGVAQWESSQGTSGSGGMMLWHVSGGASSQTYYDTLRTYLITWAPPTGTIATSSTTRPRPQAQI